MTRSPIICSVIALAIAAGATRTARADEPTRDYVVQPGDSCLGIAARELGDSSRYIVIHQLNPGLGDPPHSLQPGSILKLPGKADQPSDATLTAARGAVKVRKPATEDWGPAARGMDLFRAWRVGARARSSAEVTFRDTSRLFMRENTIVIIYGATSARSQLTTDAELESGALEARLTAMSGRRVVVHTPSAEAGLGEGNALVSVDAAAATVVANHSGKPAAVRGLDAKRQPRGAPVEVAAGMGSKVSSGQLPSPPRPLPAAPSWLAPATRFVDLGGAGATITAHWSAVATAARYHLAIHAADGRDVLATDVPAPADALELHRLAPGRYAATIATVDADGFESAPSAELGFDVVAVAVIPPGATQPLAPPAAAAEEAPDPLAVPPPLAIARGSRIVAADGITCSAGGSPAVELTVTDPAAHAISCRADAGPLPPVAITVATGSEPAATERSIEPAAVAARAPEATLGPREFHPGAIELGVYGGAWIVPGAPILGSPADPGHVISTGPVTGLRAARWINRGFGVEVEGTLARTTQAEGTATATALGWRAQLFGGFERNGLGVRILIGGGSNTLFSHGAGTATDTRGAIDLGIAETLRITGGWLLRIDARDALVRATDNHATHIPELYLGLSRAFMP